MKYSVPFIKPDFPDGDAMASDYHEILASNWFTNFGPFERKFAEAIAAYIGPEYHAATFSSATAGLIAAILAILGKGDGTRYVVMPSFTFAAGADALEWCGYLPVFVDIEADGLHMDIEATEKLLNNATYKDRIAGLLFCNAFGVGTQNIAAWEQLAAQYSLPLMIDSAAGFGSRYDSDRKVGSAGDCEIFSFHATKPFAIGEGGAVISRDKELIDTLNSISNFGFQGRNAVQLGFNGKLQEFNAAIGLRQLERFEATLQSRQAAFKQYQAALDPERFRLQANAESASLCFAVVIVLNATDRDFYLEALHQAGVEAKTYYSPSLHKQDYFKEVAHGTDLATTDVVDSAVLSLPIHDAMRPEDIALVIDTLKGLPSEH